jgi:hypothetical protein
MARASQETQQEGLGLIVTCVPEGDDVRPDLHSGPLQELMARGPRGMLERLALTPRAGLHVLSVDRERPGKGLGQPGAKPLVIVGRVPELMVEMGESYGMQFARRVELADDMCEGDGVGATRQRNQHSSVTAGEVAFSDELSDAMEEVLHKSGGSGRGW